MKGIYILIIEITKIISPKIGALGNLTFRPGLYAYVGSAQNNLTLRLKRHKRKEKRLFWHIDYLLNNPEAKITKIYVKAGNKAEECKIASMLEANGMPINGFGCSDCRCNSHIFHGESFQFLEEHVQLLKEKQNVINN